VPVNVCFCGCSVCVLCCVVFVCCVLCVWCKYAWCVVWLLCVRVCVCGCKNEGKKERYADEKENVLEQELKQREEDLQKKLEVTRGFSLTSPV